MTEDSTLIRAHQACDDCGSGDALALYSDGHTHCFSCGKTRQGDGKAPKGASMPKRNQDLLPGSISAIKARGLREETCAFWGYRIGSYQGSTVQIADYRDDSGNIVAQKLRYSDKDRGLPWVGDSKAAGLFGQHLWGASKKAKLVITEGELDAMSVSQAQNHKWPVVSIKSGASNAKKDLLKSWDWLMNFPEIVLMFDQDEAGRKAAQECAEILPPGRVLIASLPLKDANDMIKAGRAGEIITAVFSAKPYRPDSVVGVADVKEQALQPIEVGLPWFLPSLTKATHGRRWGEVYALGAGTGVGKTDLFTQQMAFDCLQLGEKIGAIYLEQTPAETLKRVAGKVSHKRFHIPDTGWTQEELAASIEVLQDRIFFYDNFGFTEWASVQSSIRFMAASEGVRIFYVDHLTALADTDHERESLEGIMRDMAMLAKELQVVILFISHLATPDGKPHEEGGRVTIRHYKGSRSIGFWSYLMLALERDQQAEDDEERQTTTLRVLKDRYTGQATGLTISLGYDHSTGLIFERDGIGAPEKDEDPF